MRNQHTTRRRTFSVSAARSAWVIGRAGRNAGGPSPVGMKTPSVFDGAIYLRTKTHLYKIGQR